MSAKMEKKIKGTSFFLIWGDTLPSHASAEAYLTGEPNVQPQGRD